MKEGGGEPNKTRGSRERLPKLDKKVSISQKDDDDHGDDTSLE